MDSEVDIDARVARDLVRRELQARRAVGRRFDGAPVSAAAQSTFVADLGAPYPIPDWLVTEDFYEEEVGPIKGGKEAYVSLVHRYSETESCLLARKAYVDRKRRGFQKDQIYREGRVFTRDSRAKRAMDRGTNFGKEVMTDDWFDTEFVAMRKLWFAGADIPYPLSGGGSVMMMQFIGDWDQAAPRLIDARIECEKAEPLLDQILWNVRLFAREETVHGDLSAYNILYWDERAWIIDFPQSVNLFHNQYGVDLLQRDIVNVCSYFKRFGIARDPQEELALALAEAYR